METSLCQRGVAQRAQKHLANGGQGEGAVPFPTELPPQSDKSPRGCVGAEREEERGFRWILVKRTAEALARGMSFSHL